MSPEAHSISGRSLQLAAKNIKTNMKSTSIVFTLLITTFSLISCTSKEDNKANQIGKYIPADQELYETIVSMDKEFFAAYNSCDLDKQASIYSDNIEFFHDKGGLMTSKQEIIDGTERNICGKVTRELIKGSIEVYPINNYGAVQIGLHKFYNNQEPDAISIASKFITMWQNDKGHWKMTKVISLH
jgi:hypothetical protein